MTILEKCVDLYHRKEIVRYQIVGSQNASQFLEGGEFNAFYSENSKDDFYELISLGFDWIYSHSIFLRIANRSKI